MNQINSAITPKDPDVAHVAAAMHILREKEICDFSATDIWLCFYMGVNFKIFDPGYINRGNLPTTLQIKTVLLEANWFLDTHRDQSLGGLTASEWGTVSFIRLLKLYGEIKLLCLNIAGLIKGLYQVFTGKDVTF